MNELTSEWVDKAEEDFYSADLLLHAGETPKPCLLSLPAMRGEISQGLFAGTFC